MSYYPEIDGHIRDKVKVGLKLSNYVTKKELNYATGVDASNLAPEGEFIAFNVEVHKLNITSLVSVPTDLKQK